MLRPNSRSCRTASLRSGRAGDLPRRGSSENQDQNSATPEVERNLSSPLIKNTLAFSS
jgi:hypothetical protein